MKRGRFGRKLIRMLTRRPASFRTFLSLTYTAIQSFIAAAVLALELNMRIVKPFSCCQKKTNKRYLSMLSEALAIKDQVANNFSHESDMQADYLTRLRRFCFFPVPRRSSSFRHCIKLNTRNVVLAPMSEKDVKRELLLNCEATPQSKSLHVEIKLLQSACRCTARP